MYTGVPTKATRQSGTSCKKITCLQHQKQQIQLRGTTFSHFSDEDAPHRGHENAVSASKSLSQGGRLRDQHYSWRCGRTMEHPTGKIQVEVPPDVDLFADSAKKTFFFMGDAT